jgi:hypothetical protein
MVGLLGLFCFKQTTVPYGGTTRLLQSDSRGESL